MRLINRHPGPGAALALGFLPFLILVAAYLWASGERLALNPNDKLLPAPESFVAALRAMALELDARSGTYLFWADTVASLARLLTGLLCAAALALVVGTLAGSIPLAASALGPLLAVLSMTPPLALLPILFIVLGLGETAKIVLIGLGVFPVMARDLAFRARDIPPELLIKAQSMGGGSLQILLRVIVPMLLPKLVAAMRLALGPAWLFLIAAEAIASTEGLGYRIFLVRRFLAMDVILPYVAWITLLAFLMDAALARLQRRLFPWEAA